MPRFPVLPQRTSAPAVFSNTPRAQAAHFGAGIGRNFSKLGSEAVELGQEVQKRQERQVKQQMSYFDLELAKQRAESDLQAPPEEASDARIKRHQSIFDTSAERVLQGYEGQGLHGRLREDIELRRDAWTQKLLAGEAEQRLRGNQQDAQGLVEHWSARVAVDAREFSTAFRELLGDEASGEAGLLAGLGLRPEALAAWRGHVLNQLLDAQMTSDPAGLLADLEAGRWQGLLPEERHRSLLEDAEEALARHHSANEVELTRTSASKSLELSQAIGADKAGLAEIRKAEEAGALSSPQAEALRVKAARAEIALQAQQMASDEFAISLSSGVGFDLANSQNRQAADGFYETTYSQAIREGASEATRALVVSMVAKTGYLQPRLARDTTGLLLGSDESRQVTGADLYGQLREAAPELVEESIDLEARAWGGVLKRWLDAGLEPADALRRSKAEFPRDGSMQIVDSEILAILKKDSQEQKTSGAARFDAARKLDQMEEIYMEQLAAGQYPRRARTEVMQYLIGLRPSWEDHKISVSKTLLSRNRSLENPSAQQAMFGPNLDSLLVLASHTLNDRSEISDPVELDGSSPTVTSAPIQLAQSAPTWVNPTNGIMRGCDAKGCGQFGAPRGGRPHYGVDYLAKVGQDVVSITDGIVHKIGYTYPGDHRRYIAIKTSSGLIVRQLYVAPVKALTIGSSVKAGDVIGTYQGLAKKFPGITEHVHVDVWKDDGTARPWANKSNVIDPSALIPIP